MIRELMSGSGYTWGWQGDSCMRVTPKDNRKIVIGI